MNKHPTERIRTVREMQATSLQQADKALRRMAAAEERLARLEGRLAERDEIIAEFREAYGRQADTIAALTAVVREIEAKAGRGVDQVLTGLEGRIDDLESQNPRYQQFFDLLIDEMPSLRTLMDADISLAERLDKYIQDTDAFTLSYEQRLHALEAKPKRGRPKGSKNKPKNTPTVEETPGYMAEDTPQGGVSSNPEASEG